jgi:hypothetical protein
MGEIDLNGAADKLRGGYLAGRQGFLGFVYAWLYAIVRVRSGRPSRDLYIGGQVPRVLQGFD